ncbi:MAG: hypothetical protein IPI87_05945 [Betaproteobacteria bacterium]|nr:hypothetical protein [Betaproteobacteria bacterium]
MTAASALAKATSSSTTSLPASDRRQRTVPVSVSIGTGAVSVRGSETTIARLPSFALPPRSSACTFADIPVTPGVVPLGATPTSIASTSAA